MITVQCKRSPDTKQDRLLHATILAYINSVNALVDYCRGQATVPKLSSATFRAALPSSIKNEVILAVKSVIRKFENGHCESLPILKKPVCTWNNQNYRILENAISFPVWQSGKCQRIVLKVEITTYQKERLVGHLGTLRITQKNGKWIAQVAAEVPLVETKPGNAVMGVDLGLKVPAVAVSESGVTKFFGNGRMNKFVKRKHRARRKALGKAKKQWAIDKLTIRSNVG